MILSSKSSGKFTMVLAFLMAAGSVAATPSPRVTTHAIASKSTATSFRSTSTHFKIPFRTGHGPVIVSRTTSAFAPPSTPMVAERAIDLSPETATVTTRQIWTSDEPRPTRSFYLHPPGAVYRYMYFIEGIHIDSLYDTDCHGGGHYVYFTVAYANGTLARDSQGQPGLFHFGTGWYATYTKLLRKAIFNDPVSHDAEQQCKSGHCLSKVLPGVLYNDEPIRLKRVLHPKLLRTGWGGAMCQYDDQVRSIGKMGVHLGSIGYFIHGANIPPAIIDWVEERVRTTYPTLEIILIVWLTVGAIPTLVIVVVLIAMMVSLAHWLYTGLPGLCASIAHGCSASREAVIQAPGKAWSKAKDGWKHGSKRGSNDVETAKDEQPPTYEQQATYELPDWPLAPPSYRTYDSRQDSNAI